MFLCYLCEKERCYTSYFCEDCRQIKNIMNVYGKKDVVSILKTTCLRDQTQIGYKVNKIIKKESKPIIDSNKETQAEQSVKVVEEKKKEPITTRSQSNKRQKH